MRMKVGALALALLLAFGVSPLHAQGAGVLQPGQIVGNFSANPNVGSAINPTPSATSCPSWLTTYAIFANTNAAPGSVPVSIFDGANCVTIGTLNATAHTWTPASGSGAASVAIGTTTVSNGTDQFFLFQNGASPAGTLGEVGSTGTGVVVRANTPTLITPVLGLATGTSIALGGAAVGSNALAITGKTAVSDQITSTLATGTAPLVVASTTNVANLNASSLAGATFASPGNIGTGTPGTAAFTNLAISGSITVNGVTLAASSAVTSAQYFVCVNASAALTVTLPSSPTNFESHLIKDCNGTDGANNITIVGAGSSPGTLVDGVASPAGKVLSTSAAGKWDSVAVTFHPTFGWLVN